MQRLPPQARRRSPGAETWTPSTAGRPPQPVGRGDDGQVLGKGMQHFGFHGRRRPTAAPTGRRLHAAPHRRRPASPVNTEVRKLGRCRDQPFRVAFAPITVNGVGPISDSMAGQTRSTSRRTGEFVLRHARNPRKAMPVRGTAARSFRHPRVHRGHHMHVGPAVQRPQFAASSSETAMTASAATTSSRSAERSRNAAANSGRFPVSFASRNFARCSTWWRRR